MICYFCLSCCEFVPWYESTFMRLPGRPGFHNPSGLAGLGHPVRRAIRLELIP
jgi:hypothetical protein